MNWLDIVVVVVLLIALLGGLKRGLIGTVLPLAGLVVGGWLASNYYRTVADALSGIVRDPGWAEVAGYGVIVLGTLAAAFVVASILGRFVRLAFLGWADRLGGAIFGAMAGATLVAAALVALLKFDVLGAGNLIEESALGSLLVQYLPMVLELLPEQLEAVRQFLG